MSLDILRTMFLRRKSRILFDLAVIWWRWWSQCSLLFNWTLRYSVLFMCFSDWPILCCHECLSICYWNILQDGSLSASFGTAIVMCLNLPAEHLYPRRPLLLWTKEYIQQTDFIPVRGYSFMSHWCTSGNRAVPVLFLAGLLTVHCIFHRTFHYKDNLLRSFRKSISEPIN